MLAIFRDLYDAIMATRLTIDKAGRIVVPE
jgi:hypothetical protein